MVNKPVLALDRAYRPVSIFSHKKAFVISLLSKCEVLMYYESVFLSSPVRKYKAPLVIRLPVLNRHWAREFPTRKAIFIRDNFTCAYCGKVLSDSEITVDHVVPKSRGGSWTWGNLCTCCKKCNQKKGDRLPEEANMSLIFKPYKPSSFRIALNKWERKMNDEFLLALKLYGIKNAVEVSV
ncbi:MAG: HNH endonuclease [Nitrospiraceae bacterium]|nr:HNH endonuclease [Nitrospiraceae bacterium]